MHSTKSRIIRYLLNSWFYIFLITIIVSGITLRCIHIDGRLYWGDEIFTSLRIAGYGSAELKQELVNKSIANVTDLMVYQQPNFIRGLGGTLQGLITEEPQHAPIYFLLANIWTYWFQDFSNSVLVVRSFSVFISLLSFPCLYWLCLELFRSQLVGLIAIAMMSVSPFHLIYSQEARPPALWFLVTILSSASLLRALRLNTNFSWFIYTISAILNLYSFLLSVFVLASHGVYIAITQGFRLTKRTIAYLITMLLCLLAFLPWILIIVSQFNMANNATGWSSDRIGSFNLLRRALNNLRDVFFSIGDGYAYLTFLLILLIVFSLYFLVRNSPPSIWGFVFSLIGVTLITSFIPDFIMGGKVFSATSRYFIALYLGVNLSFAYLFYSHLNTINKWLNNLFKSIATALLILGLISCISIIQSDASFNVATFGNSKKLAEIINKYDHPLIIISAKTVKPHCQIADNIVAAISLSYHLRSDAQFYFVDDPLQFELRPIKNAKNYFVHGGDSKYIVDFLSTKYKSKLLLGDLKNQCASQDLWYLDGMS